MTIGWLSRAGVSSTSSDHHASLTAPCCMTLVSTPTSTIQGTRTFFQFQKRFLGAELGELYSCCGVIGNHWWDPHVPWIHFFVTLEIMQVAKSDVKQAFHNGYASMLGEDFWVRSSLACAAWTRISARASVLVSWRCEHSMHFKIVQMTKPSSSNLATKAISRRWMNISWNFKRSDPEHGSWIWDSHQDWLVMVSQGFPRHLKIVLMTELSTLGCATRDLYPMQIRRHIIF